LDLLPFLTGHAASIWAVVAAGVSGVGAWLISLRNISATVERTRLAMNADVSNAEAAERAAFRTSLMAEVSELRQMIKDCETDRDALRQRLGATESQILVLKASNEIMERWVAFFNERGLSSDPPINVEPRSDGSP
jgi:predicted amino acid-binding ACT domain protein